MIHPTAIIDPSAVLAADVDVGPYSIIGSGVEIGEGSSVGSHVVIKGMTKIGKNNTIFQFASLGEMSQDKKYTGDETLLEIGDGNTIREFCTFNRATSAGGVTRIGNDNLFMAYVHVAHDCIVGDHTIFANNASIAGHVRVDDHAILSGFSGLSQGCHMGAYSFAAMASVMDKDIPPFVKVSGYYAKPFGLNSVGMKRCGFSDETLTWLKRAYKVIYRQGLTAQDAVEELTAMVSNCAEVQYFIDFIKDSTRGIVR